MSRKFKVGDIVTAPVHDPPNDWSGQVGIVVEVLKGETQELMNADVLVLVNSKKGEMYSAIWKFKNEELTPGGEASEELRKRAEIHIRTYEEHNRQRELILEQEQFVEEGIKKLLNDPRVKVEETEIRGFFGTIPAYTFSMNGELLIKLPQRDRPFWSAYYDWMKRVLERLDPTAG